MTVALGWSPWTGDIGLVRVNGFAGRAIRAAQWLDGDGFADYEHAVICVGCETRTVRGRKQMLAKCVGAQPGGADIEYYGAQDDMVWSRFNLSTGERAKIKDAALSYYGTPYSFADYAAIGAHRLHVPAPGLKTYIASSKHMICSQLVDQCYQDAGLQLFRDGRWPGLVTPGDLDQLITTRGSGWTPYRQPLPSRGRA